MAPQSVFDYATPYNIMVGRWSGLTTTFTATGEYVDSVASFVTIFWKKPHKLLHYEQEELPDLDERLEGNPHKETVAKIVRHDFDLEITGKACRSTNTSGEAISVSGTETLPGIYLFHLAFPEGQYYNNQFFTSPNERQIIGPFIAAAPPEAAPARKGAPAPSPGGVTFVVAQTFTRISYEVPLKVIRELQRKR